MLRSADNNHFAIHVTTSTSGLVVIPNLLGLKYAKAIVLTRI